MLGLGVEGQLLLLECSLGFVGQFEFAKIGDRSKITVLFHVLQIVLKLLRSANQLLAFFLELRLHLLETLKTEKGFSAHEVLVVFLLTSRSLGCQFLLVTLLFLVQQ